MGMEQATARQLAGLDRRLKPILEPEMRRALVREWLAESGVEEACRVAGAALARTRPADALRRSLAEVLTGGGTEQTLDYEIRRDLYVEAASQHNEELMRLLRSVPAHEALDEPERLLSKELAEMPLGRRRAMAIGTGDVRRGRHGAVTQKSLNLNR